MILIREAQTRPVQDSRIIFEKAINQFPGCYRFLKLYLEKEAKDGDEAYVDQLYKRFLPSTPNIDLYLAYIQHLKITKLEDPDFNAKLLEAYEFAVSKVGFDFSSYQIWNEYLQFVRTK